MLKLTVGTMIALTAAQVLGVDPQVRALRPQPAWVEWGALLTGVLAFEVLFRAARRDYPLVMVAALAGYLIPRIVGASWGSPAGIFTSATVLTAAGTAYARWAQRTEVVVPLPGITLMVHDSAHVSRSL